jgi:hypothetical protein
MRRSRSASMCPGSRLHAARGGWRHVLARLRLSQQQLQHLCGCVSRAGRNGMRCRQLRLVHHRRRLELLQPRMLQRLGVQRIAMSGKHGDRLLHLPHSVSEQLGVPRHLPLSERRANALLRLSCVALPCGRAGTRASAAVLGGFAVCVRALSGPASMRGHSWGRVHSAGLLLGGVRERCRLRLGSLCRRAVRDRTDQWLRAGVFAVVCSASRSLRHHHQLRSGIVRSVAGAEQHGDGVRSALARRRELRQRCIVSLTALYR